MHQPFSEGPISARFTFLPERAEEFLADKDENGNLVYSGQLVTQMDFDDLDEVMEYTRQFEDALENAVALLNNRVVCLSGEVYNTVSIDELLRGEGL